MSGLFCNSHDLCALERQMQQPPGYKPRGQGIYIVGSIDWRSRGNYAEIVDCIISRMQMSQLKKRVEEIFDKEIGEQIFRNRDHRKRFNDVLAIKRGNSHVSSCYAAALFLLSADQALWQRVHENVQDNGIYFDRVRLGGVNLEQYILFHAAKDVYNGTKHIRLSELADRELIPNEILRLILSAFVIEQCGMNILGQEVSDED